MVVNCDAGVAPLNFDMRPVHHYSDSKHIRPVVARLIIRIDTKRNLVPSCQQRPMFGLLRPHPFQGVTMALSLPMVSSG